MKQNMLGAYGQWAAELVGQQPSRLSFRSRQWQQLDRWRAAARARFHQLLMQPSEPCQPAVRVVERRCHDGLVQERLEWQLPFGPPTEAVFLKPAGVAGPLPAVLALHDHAMVKFFGWEKIARFGPGAHAMMLEHQRQYYGGRAWANELAKRGYAVLAHDVFGFGSRRVRLADVPQVLRAELAAVGLTDPQRDDWEAIERYHRFAAGHEHVIAKSLFCAGTSWPGLFTYEDQCALDYLCSRPDVDPSRVGCAGLSGGGLRTVYLAALDERIACACCAGMMTTWRDFLLNTSYTHTWMIYVPGLPRELDYPELLGLMAPKPVLVLNNEQDELFTLPEMRRADRILAELYAKAGAADRYRCCFYPGPHKFDRQMQAEAFDFFDRHLRGGHN